MMRVQPVIDLTPVWVIEHAWATAVTRGPCRLVPASSPMPRHLKGVEVLIAASANIPLQVLPLARYEAARQMALEAGLPAPDVTLSQLLAHAGMVIGVGRLVRDMTFEQTKGHAQEPWANTLLVWEVEDVQPLVPALVGLRHPAVHMYPTERLVAAGAGQLLM